MRTSDLLPEIPMIFTIVIGLSLFITGISIELFYHDDQHYGLALLLIMIGMFGFVFFGGIISMQLRFTIEDMINRKTLKKQSLTEVS